MGNPAFMPKARFIAIGFVILGLLLAYVGYSDASDRYGNFEALLMACPGLGMTFAGVCVFVLKAGGLNSIENRKKSYDL